MNILARGRDTVLSVAFVVITISKQPHIFQYGCQICVGAHFALCDCMKESNWVVGLEDKFQTINKLNTQSAHFGMQHFESKQLLTYLIYTMFKLLYRNLNI